MAMYCSGLFNSALCAQKTAIRHPHGCDLHCCERNGLYSGEILAGSGIDLDLVSGLYEERNGNLCSGLNDSGLACTGSGITLESGLGLSDLELYKKRRLD